MTQTRLTEADNGKSFEVTAGSVIIVSLEENPTTGFRWTIDRLSQRIVALQHSEFVLGKDSGIGGGGERKLTLKAKRSGETQLLLKLWRDWEGEASVAQRYTVTLKVR